MSEQTTLERLRALEAKVLRLQAGEIPSDALTLGSGQGNAVRIQFRQGGRGGGGLNLAQLPAIVYDTETGSAGGTVRIANDGFEAMPVPTLSARDQRAADVVQAGASPVVSGGVGGAGGLTNQFVELVVVSTSVNAVVDGAAWTAFGAWAKVLQGALWDPTGASASHSISVRASTTAGTAQIRLRDLTAPATLWTVTGITSAAFYTATSVSNWPSGDALIDIEGYSDAAATVTLSGMSWWMFV